MPEFIQRGGPMMWLVILCSIVALAVFLERLIYFHRASIQVGDLLRGLANVIRKGNYAEALQECAATPGPIARVAHAMIAMHSRPRSELRQIGEEAATLELPKIERGLPLLATIAYVTPLIGLLGTLLGLLEAFQQISSQSGYATAADIAGGVYQSLLTSSASLAVAIPAFVVHNYLTARANQLASDMERTGIEILNIMDEVRHSPAAESSPVS